ncbi:MAG TPA: ATP-binding protein [Tepidisphaeraceae bacterium]|nr:ATP-binding protein [Tepidisphaeraceae bacterium]
MQLIVFIGLQGSGKSSFYRQRLVDTHVRLGMDMLRTRHRERLLFEACLAAKQPTVIDNTNPTAEERARYVAPAKAHHFEVVGCYFESRVADCTVRNEQRPAEQVVPRVGLLGTYKRLVCPSPAEGFDRLWYVRTDGAGGFVVEAWKDGPADEV